ncbi:prolyl-tRNA synthetase associated domain-containing protein [Photobacterium nomapromontoriensis]|uniref:prolyl-tRNA synthetase associated domain-containing protein n=1 Tax=Photobacterium nomapromontoriensis TaxID=2910237 RepID=UPI003D0E80EB
MCIFEMLDGLAISYQKYDHAPVFTCDEANSLNLYIPGAKTKNLFLRDRKGERHFLVVVSDEKQIDLKYLSEHLNVKRLSFASAERLSKYLRTEPGSVSILDVINDHQGLVELIIDQDVWSSLALQCHPFVNTITLVINLKDIEKLLEHFGRTPKIIMV